MRHKVLLEQPKQETKSSERTSGLTPPFRRINGSCKIDNDTIEPAGISKRTNSRKTASHYSFPFQRGESKKFNYPEEGETPNPSTIDPRPK